MEEHNIDKTIGEMLNSLVHSRDPCPIIFMVSMKTFFDILSQLLLQIKYLSNLVTEQELDEYGIKVTGPVP